jgi:hypothetical protein
MDAIAHLTLILASFALSVALARATLSAILLTARRASRTSDRR